MKEILNLKAFFLLILINSNHVLSFLGFKKTCTINEYKGKHFVNRLSAKKLYIDDSVIAKFKKFDELAEKCKVIIQQDSSFIKQELSSKVKFVNN